MKSLLDRCITDEVSTIVSTVRKGSWIIEDYLRRSGKIIPHFTSDERLDPIVTSGTVLIFDDSIHTGETVLSVISNLSKNQKIKICCILINEDAKNQLIAKGLTNIQYYRIFKRYASYVKRNGSDQELSTDCQSYCYIHFLIPYISGLTYNYSPDYTSILIKIGNDSSSNLDKITTVVLESVKDLVSESFEVYRNQRILRTSSELHENYLVNIFKQLIFEDLELDMGKLRMTVVVWKGYAEIVVTPIISCRIKSNVDYSEFLYKSSKKIFSQEYSRWKK